MTAARLPTNYQLPGVGSESSVEVESFSLATPTLASPGCYGDRSKSPYMMLRLYSAVTNAGTDDSSDPGTPCLDRDLDVLAQSPAPTDKLDRMLDLLKEDEDLQLGAAPVGGGARDDLDLDSRSRRSQFRSSRNCFSCCEPSTSDPEGSRSDHAHSTPPPPPPIPAFDVVSGTEQAPPTLYSHLQNTPPPAPSLPVDPPLAPSLPGDPPPGSSGAPMSNMAILDLLGESSESDPDLMLPRRLRRRRSQSQQSGSSAGSESLAAVLAAAAEVEAEGLLISLGFCDFDSPQLIPERFIPDHLPLARPAALALASLLGGGQTPPPSTPPDPAPLGSRRSSKEEPEEVEGEIPLGGTAKSVTSAKPAIQPRRLNTTVPIPISSLPDTPYYPFYPLGQPLETVVEETASQLSPTLSPRISPRVSVDNGVYSTVERKPSGHLLTVPQIRKSSLTLSGQPSPLTLSGQPPAPPPSREGYKLSMESLKSYHSADTIYFSVTSYDDEEDAAKNPGLHSPSPRSRKRATTVVPNNKLLAWLQHQPSAEELEDSEQPWPFNERSQSESLPCRPKEDGSLDAPSGQLLVPLPPSEPSGTDSFLSCPPDSLEQTSTDDSWCRGAGSYRGVGSGGGVSQEDPAEEDGTPYFFKLPRPSQTSTVRRCSSGRSNHRESNASTVVMPTPRSSHTPAPHHAAQAGLRRQTLDLGQEQRRSLQLQQKLSLDQTLLLRPQQEQLCSEQEQLFPEQEQLFPEQEQLSPDQEQLCSEQEQLFPEQEQLFPEQEQLFPEQEQLFPEQEQLFPEQEQLCSGQEQTCSKQLCCEQEVLYSAEVESRLTACSEQPSCTRVDKNKDLFSLKHTHCGGGVDQDDRVAMVAEIDLSGTDAHGGDSIRVGCHGNNEAISGQGNQPTNNGSHDNNDGVTKVLEGSFDGISESTGCLGNQINPPALSNPNVSLLSPRQPLSSQSSAQSVAAKVLKKQTNVSIDNLCSLEPNQPIQTSDVEVLKVQLEECSLEMDRLARAHQLEVLEMRKQLDTLHRAREVDRQTLDGKMAAAVEECSGLRGQLREVQRGHKADLAKRDQAGRREVIEQLQLAKDRMAHDKEVELSQVRERCQREAAEARRTLGEKEAQVAQLKLFCREREEASSALSEQLRLLRREAAEKETRLREAQLEESRRVERQLSREKAQALARAQEEAQTQRQREVLELRGRLGEEKQAALAELRRKLSAAAEDLTRKMQLCQEEAKSMSTQLEDSRQQLASVREELIKTAKKELRAALLKERFSSQKELKLSLHKEREAHKLELYRLQKRLEERSSLEQERTSQFKQQISELKTSLDAERLAVRSARQSKLSALAKAREGAQDSLLAELAAQKDRLSLEHKQELGRLAERGQRLEAEGDRRRVSEQRSASREKELLRRWEQDQLSVLKDISAQCQRVASLVGRKQCSRPGSAKESTLPSNKSAAILMLQKSIEDVHSHVLDLRAQLDKEKMASAKSLKELEATLRKAKLDHQLDKSEALSRQQERLVTEYGLLAGGRGLERPRPPVDSVTTGVQTSDELLLRSMKMAVKLEEERHQRTKSLLRERTQEFSALQTSLHSLTMEHLQLQKAFSSLQSHSTSTST